MYRPGNQEFSKNCQKLISLQIAFNFFTQYICRPPHTPHKFQLIPATQASVVDQWSWATIKNGFLQRSAAFKYEKKVFLPKNLVKNISESHLNTHPGFHKKNDNDSLFFTDHYTFKKFAGRYIDPRRRAPCVYESGSNCYKQHKIKFLYK